MSNQGMSGAAPEDGDRSTRGVFEEMLADNLGSARAVRELAHQVGSTLFGLKPAEVKAKENVTAAPSFFNKARDTAISTKICLSETRDELEDILKELK